MKNKMPMQTTCKFNSKAVMITVKKIERIIKLKMIKRMIFKNRRKLIMCRKTVKSQRDGYHHIAQIQAKRPANLLKMLGAK